MKDFGLVSLILPVYNVEAYLPQCLDSICKQTYRNLEILVIDDASPDRCGEIADSYAQRDERVKVLHISNRGAAGARNVGLDNCTGEYIMFVDSDDWLEENAVESLLCALQETGSDIVQCQYTDEYVNESKEHSYMDAEGVRENVVFLEEMISRWEYIVIWNKLYKAEFLKEIRLVEGRCIDDEFFTYQVILKVKKIAYITDYLYHYRQRKSGAMGNPQKERQRLRDQVDFITQRYQPIVQAFPQLKAKLLEHMMEVLMSVLRNGVGYRDVYHYAKKHLWKYGMWCLLRRDITTSTKKSILVYLVKKPKTGFCSIDRIEKKQENYFA